MTLATPQYEETTPTLSTDNRASTEAPVSSEKETVIPSQVNFSFNLISLSGMTKTPVSVSDFVARAFSVLRNVQAVLAGKSGDVLHVWVMIDEWTPAARKLVYSIQRIVMKQLGGLQFDFYVIDLPHDTRPQEMVSDIPVIFDRAQQNPTFGNCSA